MDEIWCEFMRFQGGCAVFKCIDKNECVNYIFVPLASCWLNKLSGDRFLLDKFEKWQQEMVAEQQKQIDDHNTHDDDF